MRQDVIFMTDQQTEHIRVTSDEGAQSPNSWGTKLSLFVLVVILSGEFMQSENTPR
jgi:hypothetical protein